MSLTVFYGDFELDQAAQVVVRQRIGLPLSAPVIGAYAPLWSVVLTRTKPLVRAFIILRPGGRIRIDYGIGAGRKSRIYIGAPICAGHTHIPRKARSLPRPVDMAILIS